MNTTILQLKVETSEVDFIETLLSKLKHSIRVRRLDEIEDENFELTQEDLRRIAISKEQAHEGDVMSSDELHKTLRRSWYGPHCNASACPAHWPRPAAGRRYGRRWHRPDIPGCGKWPTESDWRQ